MSAWSKLYEDVASHIQHLSDAGCDVPFFRGQSNVKWKIKPSLARMKSKDSKERQFYYDFLSLSGSLLPHGVSSWNTLFSMQHHGLPTRLLDWSLSFSTALHFALKHSSPRPTEACVWVLNPFELNGVTCSDEVILTPPDDFEGGYYENFITGEKAFPHQVVAINPIRIDPRQVAQESVFTLSGYLSKPLNRMAPNAFKCFKIPLESRDGATQFLKLAGVNEFRLFPDLDGLARFINES
jgi:hypothetical protein